MSLLASVDVRGAHPYEVSIGERLLDDMPAYLPAARRVAIVHADAMSAVAEQARRRLSGAGWAAEVIPVPDGEGAKDLRVAAQLWAAFASAGLDRADLVLGVGGGATTDVAGFAAATWLRGVRVAFLPTSLLGMVDAAIGGKTGINTPAGKNLVGAFHPPEAVICDLSLLETLPAEEWASGLAEVVKCGFIADTRILSLVADDPRRHVAELVERAVRVKADVVSADLREAGLREVLNYGHTLGHAIERLEDYSWRHGAAISVGMVYAAALARVAGRSDLVSQHREVLRGIQLPISYPGEAWPRLREAMRVDKKARAGRLRFIVLDALGVPGVLDDPDPELLTAAYQEVAT